MNLFFLELKRIFKSFIFWGLGIAFVLAITSQLGNTLDEFNEPDPNQEYYGNYLTDDISYIYPNLIDDLITSVDTNYFATYPYGFYRERNLKQDELIAIKDIISELIGIPYEDINENEIVDIPNKKKLEIQLDKIDAIIGGGSFYSKDKYRIQYGNKGMNYEEAVADYCLMKKNGYDVAFARYFSDYAGIFALLLSWFIGIYFWNKDRREAIANTLYIKQESSKKIILSRVIAMSVSLLCIVLMIFTYYEIKILMVFGSEVLSPVKAYVLITMWILPIILFVVSLSSFLTVTTNSILLTLLGPIISMVYLMFSSANIFYNVGYGLLIRYNSVGNEAYFSSKVDTFLASRTVWIIIDIIIIIFTVFIYERRRRGYDVFKNHFSNKNRANA
ncbi:hypothetical protein [Vagococcus lutrae]|uniref:hypothetical protein n=1 Tax=Vagococcus lutrae TaxID=81947 RepID=UPI002A803C97|nr:hypothetical protein [Vagococcus lutrae]MDY3706650.1 hypothetical protein [Vagococcus lutrae]